MTDAEQSLLEEVQFTNQLLQEQNSILRMQLELSKSQDWKLWIMSNAVIDGLLKAKLIDEDPRLEKIA